jgi:hypothetical protein
MKVVNNPFSHNDANWFTVFMKAFVEKFNGRPPTKGQWDLIVQILEDVPTEKFNREPV